MTRRRRCIALATLAVSGWTLVGAAPAKAGGGCHNPAPTEGTGQTVELSMNCMSPRVLRAKVGETVTFVNRDEVVHNVVGSEWGTDELRPGASYTETVPAGIHPYSCTLHPGMVGTIVVGEVAAATAAPATIAASAVSDAGDDDGTTPLVPAAAAGVLALGTGLAIGRRSTRR